MIIELLMNAHNETEINFISNSTKRNTSVVYRAMNTKIYEVVQYLKGINPNMSIIFLNYPVDYRVNDNPSVQDIKLKRIPRITK